MGSTFGIIHRFKGATAEQYDNTVKVVHPDGGKGLPPGQTYHAAGPVITDSGDHDMLVVALWDSEASWTSFRDTTLLPGLAKVENGPPAPPEETTFEVRNLVAAPKAALV